MAEVSAREGGTAAGPVSRSGGPRAAWLLAGVGLCWSLFQLWIASPLPFILNLGIVTETQARSIHLGFAVFLAFAAYPAVHGGGRPDAPPTLGWLYLAGAVALAAWATLRLIDMAAGPPAPVIAGMAVALGLMAVSLLRPAAEDIPGQDWLLALAGALAALYLYLQHVDLAERPGRPVAADLLASGVGMLLLLEATRRALGPALAVIAGLFLIFSFAGPWMPDLIAHRGASFSRAASQFWLSGEGVFGIALGVSTSFVFLFVLFGALLERAGAGHYFIQVAFSLLGHLRGGPAKAAVVASGMTGVISGSSIANTVTTGTFTIPLMKRVGFRAEKAGAVEVASSVNGQLMPPVMGAAAFLMVEYVGIPYIEVIRHALLPAVIAYVALLYIVHLEAVKAGMEGVPPRVPHPLFWRLLMAGLTVSSLLILAGGAYYGLRWLEPLLGEATTPLVGALLVLVYLGLLWNAARQPPLLPEDTGLGELPPVGPTVNSGLHFVLPVVVLVWALVVERLSPALAAFWAVAFLIVIVLTQRPFMALFRRRGELASAVIRGVHDLGSGLVTGARNMVGIGVATATAGVVVGTVSMTGIGLGLTQVVEVLSGGNLLLMLVLVAALSLVLGLGLPTTANYIIVATLMAPVVVELGADAGLVVPLIAVHLFVFYFGIMADVTPPVGLASFAAAAISRGEPVMTGVHAFRYSLRMVVLPFIFVFNTQLLLIGIESWWSLLLTVAGATVAMLLFAAATQGYFLARSRWYESVLLLLVSFTLLHPGFWMDRLQDEYRELPPTALEEVVQQLPAGGHLRLWLEGLDAEGREVSRPAMLPLEAADDVAARLDTAGLTLERTGDGSLRVSEVRHGTAAQRMGIDFGWEVRGVLVPSGRPSAAWFFLPALGLLMLVAALQYRRSPGPGRK